MRFDRLLRKSHARRKAPYTLPQHHFSFSPLTSPGQVHAERLYQVIVVVPSVIGFFHGYFTQSFFTTFKWWLVGSVIAGLVSIPSWPFFLTDAKVPWQPIPEDHQVDQEEEEAESEAAVEDKPEVVERKGGGTTKDAKWKKSGKQPSKPK